MYKYIYYISLSVTQPKTISRQFSVAVHPSVTTYSFVLICHSADLVAHNALQWSHCQLPRAYVCHNFVGHTDNSPVPFYTPGGERQCERQIYFPRTILIDKARTRPGVLRSIHWAMAFLWVGHLVSVQIWPYTRNYRSVDNLLPCIKNEFYLTDLSWLPVWLPTGYSLLDAAERKIYR